MLHDAELVDTAHIEEDAEPVAAELVEAELHEEDAAELVAELSATYDNIHI